MKVRLFGVLKDKTNTGELEAPNTCRKVEELENWLLTIYPILKDYQPYWAVAVDRNYVSKDCALEESSEVAFLPPVSGG
jgi:molybdopterin converting factor subunit 1